MEIQVRTKLRFPYQRVALAEFLRGLGYEPSSEPPAEGPAFDQYVSELRLAPREREILRLRLTPREREIVALIARGHTYREIARRLFVSPRTVETHQQNVMAKLQLRRRQELLDRPEPDRAFVFWLAGTVGTAAAEELAQAAAAWMREHLPRRRRDGTIRVIYGADDKLLAEVPIDEDGPYELDPA